MDSPENQETGASTPFETLSPRERQVAVLIASGADRTEVAAALGIARKTVDSHRANVLEKLSLRNISELTRAAIRAGLIVALLSVVACNVDATNSTSSALSQATLSPSCSVAVTEGVAAIGSTVDSPAMRAVGHGSTGDAASLVFRYRGSSTVPSRLADGSTRRQLGLKLRAMDGCNLVYLMWRLDPSSQLEAQVKYNPTLHDSSACGVSGYVVLTPTTLQPMSTMTAALHEIRAEIVGAELHAWIDDGPLSLWTLPTTALGLRGPAGVRSDNVRFDWLSLLTD